MGAHMSYQEQPLSQYPVGSIVNGHVWTGSAWVPVQVVPDSSPAYVKQTFSEQFQGLPAVVRVVIVAGLIGFGAWVFYFAILPFIETAMSL